MNTSSKFQILHDSNFSNAKLQSKTLVKKRGTIDFKKNGVGINVTRESRVPRGGAIPLGEDLQDFLPEAGKAVIVRYAGTRKKWLNYCLRFFIFILELHDKMTSGYWKKESEQNQKSTSLRTTGKHRKKTFEKTLKKKLSRKHSSHTRYN